MIMNKKKKYNCVSKKSRNTLFIVCLEYMYSLKKMLAANKSRIYDSIVCIRRNHKSLDSKRWLTLRNLLLEILLHFISVNKNKKPITRLEAYFADKERRASENSINRSSTIKDSLCSKGNQQTVADPARKI